jgi:hypothetical protein
MSTYKALPVGVNTTVTLNGSKICGFLAATTGTVAITIRQENTPDVVLPTFPVTAGVWVDLPVFIGTVARSTITTAGGASGILCMS